MNGAYVVLKCLENLNVDVVFGYPGGAVIPLYHELTKFPKIKHYRCSHEQHVVHGADGYARATGKVGVAFVTSGPGATNAVTGIATAFMDSVPLVIISGQVPAKLLGRDSFQEIDITGMTMSITKHNFIVRDINELSNTIHKAFQIASEGRPGPVLVDIPKNIFMEECPLPDLYQEKGFKGEETDYSTEHVETIVNMINRAQRPIIYSGGGVIISHSEEALLKIAEKSDIPILNTLMGLGSVDRHHPLSLGLAGMHGSRKANFAINECDLLLAVGVRFSDRVIGNADEFAPKATIIHLDRDTTEISKNIKVQVNVSGNIKTYLEAIEPQIEVMKRGEWKKWIFDIEENLYKPENSLNCENVYQIIDDYYKGEAIFVTDVGQHQLWTAQKIKFKYSRSFITSGGLGTMGFGLGAAIGSKVGCPEKPVVLITGDGSFRMNMSELSTLADYDIKVDILMIKNNALGMVRQWQNLFQDRVYSETDIKDTIDFTKFADAFGFKCFVPKDGKELEDSLKEASQAAASTLTIIEIENKHQVRPIVPPGQGIIHLIE